MVILIRFNRQFFLDIGSPFFVVYQQKNENYLKPDIGLSEFSGVCLTSSLASLRSNFLI